MASRINVKGTSGSGKTTFAVELARRLRLTFIELDALHHGPNWSEPTDEEFRARVREAMAAAPDGWVIDGNYDSKLGETVLGEADQIVWLDLPFFVKWRRLWARTISRIRDAVELWSGNRESWRNAFWGWNSLFFWMVRAHFRQKREYPRRFGDDPRLVRLRSVEEARRWLDSQGQAWDDGGMQEGDGSSEGSTPLGDYLVELGREDGAALERFFKNPERAMREAGVSEEDRDLVLSGNVDRIHEIVRKHFAGNPVAYIVHPGNWPIVHF